MYRIHEAQRVQHWAIVVILSSCVALNLICLMFGSATLAVAESVAAYVPAVSKLLRHPTEIGTLPARVYAVNFIAMPLYVLALTYRQNFLFNFRAGVARSGRGFGKAILFIYSGGVALCVFMWALVFFAPLELSPSPRLWGQHALHAMLNSHLGLLLLAPPVTAALALAAYALLFLACLPFTALQAISSRGEPN